MIIHRSNPSGQYTVIPNAALRDPRLSYEARGVLAELLSRPADWAANADGLADAARAQRGEAGEGRRKMRAAFAALEAAGYLRRVRVRNPRGRMVTELHVYDVPQTDVTTGGTPVPPAETPVSPAQTDVPPGRYAGGGGTGVTTGGTSVPPAETLVFPGQTDVPLTGTSVGGTSKRSKENEVTEPLSPLVASLHADLSAVVPGVTARETELALAEVKSRPGVRHAPAVLRAEIRDGTAPELVALVRSKAALPMLLPECGQCDNRFIYDGQGRAVRCPRCHPAVQPAPREVRAS